MEAKKLNQQTTSKALVSTKRLLGDQTQLNPMDKTMKTYRCLLCGRNKFQRPYTPHNCVGGFRKNFRKAETNDFKVFTENNRSKEEQK